MIHAPVRPAPAPSVFNAAAVILVCVITLGLLGLTILFSASASFQVGPYFYLKKQIFGALLAIGVCLVVSRLNLDFVRQYAWWFGGATAVALVAVLIPGLGVEVNGSRRWLGLGPVRVQVSEFAKLGMVFVLAHYLALNQSRIGEFKRGFLIPGAMIAGCAGLVILEPDYGTAALIGAVGLLLLFLAGARWAYILPALGMAVAGLAAMVIHNPNRLYRMMAFLDVEANKQGGSYQLYQSLAAFAVGGVEGVGLGQGRQQYAFIPEAHTDFIFAIVGEELGLPFTLGVTAIYLLIFAVGVLHLRRAPNLFHYLLMSGALLLLTLQAIINLGVVTGLLPTKGMSLPFISAGLSNLLLMGMIVGLFLNSQRAWARLRFGADDRSLREVTA
jgi:cell division protein FtsW